MSYRRELQLIVDNADSRKFKIKFLLEPLIFFFIYNIYNPILHVIT